MSIRQISFTSALSVQILAAKLHHVFQPHPVQILIIGTQQVQQPFLLEKLIDFIAGPLDMIGVMLHAEADKG